MVPPRYDRGDWREGDGVFNAAALASYTRRLADRIEGHVRAGDFPLVLGGDCSINLGAALALRRAGRYGPAVVDASPDFRHPGNSDRVGAAGGEEVALATGRGQDDLTDLEGLRPCLRDEDVRYFGIRDCFDEDRAELAELKIPVVTVGDLREWGAETLATVTRQAFEIPELDGFWVHLDADVLDPSCPPWTAPTLTASRPTNWSRCCGRCWPPSTASASTSRSTTPTWTRRARPGRC